MSSAIRRNLAARGSPWQLARDSGWLEAARVTGRAWVNGVHAIVISGYPYTTRLPKGMVGATNARVRYALYVDPATHLPVRVVASPISLGGRASSWRYTNAMTIHWLRPTKANLAKTLIRIPLGYRHVKSIWN